MKRKIILGTIAGILIILCAICIGYYSHINYIQQEEQTVSQTTFNEEVQDLKVPADWYESDGFDNLDEWLQEISDIKARYATYIADTIIQYSGYLTEEQLNVLEQMSITMATSHSIKEIHGILNGVDLIQAEAQSTKDTITTQQNPVNYSDASTSINHSDTFIPITNNYDNSYSSDFKNAGVVYQNGWRYTWYSQNMLPGEGLSIPGRHVDERGFVCDEEGNIVVASSSDAYGDVIDTPYGQGKVYDSGCAAGTRDLYTNY